ncbi:MAG: glycosyltransferase, partial [Myxococcales bacterium]|nr:glycosyltransferase [Myxococcales bacterium]
MRVVAITRLFPNPLEPLWCLFNKQQLAALGRLDDVEVLGVIPWFPGARVVPSSAAGRLLGVPGFEQVDGLRVQHPRYLFVPKLPSASAALYAASLMGDVWRRRRQVDVLFGAWAYPDGAATVMMARAAGLPSVVKVHGSDLNVIARIPSVRAQLRALLPRATRMAAVSRALADELVTLGVPRAQVAVVPNGVDASLFHPRDRTEARAQLALPQKGRIVVYVGRIVRDKGLLELIDAMAALAPAHPDLTLVVVGDGALRGECEERARPLADRIRFVGARPLDEIPRWLGACDLFVLPSWNEGTPN